jgi:hypothetical protein
MTMKTLLIFLNAIVISVLVAAMGVPRESSGDVVPPPDARPARLIDLLPASTVAAVQLRDLASRWGEVRGLVAFAELQDRLLPAVGMSEEDLPRVVGDEALIAIATVSDGKRIVPLALLRPPRIRTALSWIRERPALSVHREDDTLWVVRDTDACELEWLTRSSGSGPDLHVREVAARLPEGGLVRGWIEPESLRRLLLERVPGVLPAALDLVSASAAAELAAVRFVGFRRDLQPSGVVTDAVVGYDLSVLPPEVAAGLAAPPGGAVLPEALPPGVAAMASFGTQTNATLPWLRFVADSDPQGPLRNLGFWIDEIEERTGVDIERDILDRLGERGWLALLDGASKEPWGWVAMIESEDRPDLERAMLDLQGWWIEHTWGRTLGLAIPRNREDALGGHTVHRAMAWTPFGEFAGPAFLVTDRHLLLGSGTEALSRGLRLLEAKESWQPHAGDDAMMVGGAAVARLAGTLLDDEIVGREAKIAAALENLASSIDNASAGVRYEGDAVRVHGELAFSVAHPR